MTYPSGSSTKYSMSKSQQTSIRIGVVRMPSLCAALLAAVFVHAIVLTGIAAFYAWSSQDRSPAPPKPLYTMGQPIQVQLADPPVQEPVPAHEPDTPPPANADMEPTETSSPDPTSEPVTSNALQPHQSQTNRADEQARTAESIWRRRVVTRSIERQITQTADSLAAIIARLPELLEQAAPEPPPLLSESGADEPSEPAFAALADPTPPADETDTAADRPIDQPDTSAEQIKTGSESKAKSKPAATGLTRVAAIQRVPTPTYPERARRAGHEGTVLVEVEILADGSVGDVALHQSSGYRTLDRAATRAARRGRYAPAMQEGTAITAWLIVPFEFKIEDR